VTACQSKRERDHSCRGVRTYPPEEEGNPVQKIKAISGGEQETRGTIKNPGRGNDHVGEGDDDMESGQLRQGKLQTRAWPTNRGGGEAQLAVAKMGVGAPKIQKKKKRYSETLRGGTPKQRGGGVQCKHQKFGGGPQKPGALKINRNTQAKHPLKIRGKKEANRYRQTGGQRK